MKITRIDVWAKPYRLVRGRYAWSGGNAIDDLDTTIARLTTDEGLTGFGESCPIGPAYLPSHALGVRAAAREIAPALIGQDPLQLAAINARMEAALLGHAHGKVLFDEACWDILGKAAGQSASVLLGGRYREEYGLYTPVSQASPAEMAEALARYRAEGYRQFQLKVGGRAEEDIERIRRCVEVGLPGAVVADANTGWQMRDALRVARGIDDLDVYMEQPCKTYEESLHVRRKTTLPFVLDEVIDSVRTVLRGFHDGAMDVINIKLSKLGGLTRAKQVRDLCETLGIAMTIEDTMGGDICSAAVAHLVASTRPEFVFSSWLPGSFTVERIAAGAPAVREGTATVPSGPGLGIEVDEAWLGEPLFTVA